MGIKSNRNIIKRIGGKVKSYFKRRSVVKVNTLILNRNCEELSIYAFDKARSTSDLRWLVEGYTGREKIELPEGIESIFNDIMNEYCELTGDNKSLQYYELVVEVSDLKLDFDISTALLGTLLTEMTKETRKEVVKELGHRGFLLNEGKPFNEEFERLERQLRQRRTKLNRKKSELEEFRNQDGEIISIHKQKINLLRITELREIDLKSTSVIEWVELCNVADEIIRAKRKAA